MRLLQPLLFIPVPPLHISEIKIRQMVQKAQNIQKYRKQNTFYYNIGDTLNGADIDFIYAQTNDAFSQIRTVNVHTKKEALIGSWNERFSYTDEDIDAYLTFSQPVGNLLTIAFHIFYNVLY